MDTRPRLQGALALALLLPLMSACGGPGASSGAPSVWIDVPVDNLELPELREVQIEGHASSSQGISQVQVRVNGELLASLDMPSSAAGLARFGTRWTPPGLGDYTIEVVAITDEGISSEPDRARIRFGVAPTQPGPTPPGAPVEPTPPGTPTEVPPATSLPEGVVQFWAEPPAIEAGACTNIRWHAENVQQIVFGGIAQELDGSYHVCLCAGERYSLFVTYLDGAEERVQLDVTVSGTCASPTPPDTEPPPAPAPASPINGGTLTCRASQTMAWSAVSDPGGIAEYQVQVQRHSGDGVWLAAPGSPINGISGTSASIGVECGWYYRWRVRAVDGLGNVGAWSSWWTFTIELT